MKMGKGMQMIDGGRRESPQGRGACREKGIEIGKGSFGWTEGRVRQTDNIAHFKTTLTAMICLPNTEHATQIKMRLFPSWESHLAFSTIGACPI